MKGCARDSCINGNSGRPQGSLAAGWVLRVGAGSREMFRTTFRTSSDNGWTKNPPSSPRALRSPPQTGTLAAHTTTATLCTCRVRLVTAMISHAASRLAFAALRFRGLATASPSGETCVVAAARQYLQEKRRLVDCLSPADYAAVDAGIGASVGGHMRHTLDHFSKCLAAAQSPPTGGATTAPGELQQVAGDSNSPGPAVAIRYDHRVRGGSVETCPSAASRCISSLLQQLRELPRGRELRKESIGATFVLALEGAREEHEFESNLERELFFCCHHGIHHDAMIQLILRGMGEKGEVAIRQAGSGLGVAPSTLEHLQRKTPGKGREER